MNSGSENRWQGYSHQELYTQLHAGPGAGAAAPAADTWNGLSQALDELQQDISSGVSTSGATWTGAAADSARDALGPLGDWAQQAATAADMMRISTELQGSLLAKARADMPAPVPVTAEQPNGLVTVLQHLIGEQTDHEIQEAASNAAEQKAFQVMAEYESGTNDNTNTLGDFGQPPQLIVDSSPVAMSAAVRSELDFSARSRSARGTTTDRTRRAADSSESSRSSGSSRPSRSSSPSSTSDPDSDSADAVIPEQHRTGRDDNSDHTAVSRSVITESPSS
ncbi:MAG TPA: PPE domain-containing protein [Pseudonocardiaceae bacterium]|jgi:PPE-repeat protein|nr:PPE domain-containing protein [Pseudonocardiaceae bacterium]